MQVIADFHTHSRFSRACSLRITLETLEEAAEEKGISVVGTGDFTHNGWLSEIKSSLEPDGESGLFRLKGSKTDVRFFLTTEVCTISAGRDGRQKRIHHCIAMPNIESVEAFNAELAKRGSLESDGRPMLTMSAPELVENAFSASKDAFVFPAHVWTPWFGALGAMSGFNSIKEAYEDQEKHIYALETGLSSNPEMNWRVSALDKYALVSNSDMHSTPKMGREANVFDIQEGKLGYRELIEAVKGKDRSKFKKTIEFYPEEGKYHFDGHRNCKFSVDPSMKKLDRCPTCGKKLTIGVMHRVNDLADRPVGYVPQDAVPFTSIVPLREVVAYVMRKSGYSPLVASKYNSMILSLGDEFHILMVTKIEDIEKAAGEEIARAIQNVRENRIHIEPGYDGVFGELDLLGREEKRSEAPARRSSQKKLF